VNGWEFWRTRQDWGINCGMWMW